MPKARADQLLVERGLVESRARAQALILAGHVFSGESKIAKAGQALDQQAPLEVRGRDHPWVSRGGIKLAHGLNHFGWDVTGAVAIDVGSSTEGLASTRLTAAPTSLPGRYARIRVSLCLSGRTPEFSPQRIFRKQWI